MGRWCNGSTSPRKGEGTGSNPVRSNPTQGVCGDTPCNSFCAFVTMFSTFAGRHSTEGGETCRPFSFAHLTFRNPKQLGGYDDYTDARSDVSLSSISGGSGLYSDDALAGALMPARLGIPKTPKPHSLPVSNWAAEMALAYSEGLIDGYYGNPSLEHKMYFAASYRQGYEAGRHIVAEDQLAQGTEN